MNRVLTYSCVGAIALASALVSAETLYEAPISNLRPDSSMWGWSLLNLPGTNSPVSGPSGLGYVTLNTSSSLGNMAGWGKVSPIDLDRTKGYTATWQTQVVSETHNSDNQRAGLSVFVLGDDHKGVELGFWSNEIFAYSTGFVPSESVSIDTTAAIRTYSLSISGNSYTLSIGGQKSLTGALRDYSAFGAPYNVPDALWYGDDTSRGSSVSHLKSFAIAPVPEPSSFAALGLLGVGFLLRRRQTS